MRGLVPEQALEPEPEPVSGPVRARERVQGPVRARERVQLGIIATEPNAALTKQYVALMATEGVKVDFADEAVDRLAEIAAQVNERQENIGARRLHTVLERLLDTLSYEAPDRDGQAVLIDKAYVDAHLGELVQDPDLSRYIL